MMNSFSMDKLLQDLDSQIRDRNAQIATILDEIVQLKIRRERCFEVMKGFGDGPAVNVRPVPRRIVRETEPSGKAVTAIVDALRTAGVDGLEAGELNKRVRETGLSAAAVAKAKTRLKRALLVTLEDGRWRLPQKAA